MPIKVGFYAFLIAVFSNPPRGGGTPGSPMPSRHIINTWAINTVKTMSKRLPGREEVLGWTEGRYRSQGEMDRRSGGRGREEVIKGL